MAELLPQYFALEGCDGVGKSTLAQAVLEEARSRSLKGVWIKEPARYISYPPSASGMKLLRLFTLDRLALVESVVRPWLTLSPGAPIISDRCFVSTMVGQGRLHSDLALIWEISSREIPYLPGTVFYCWAPVETIVERLSGREDQSVMSLREGSSGKAPHVDIMEVTRALDRYEAALGWLRRHTSLRIIPLDMRLGTGDLVRMVLEHVKSSPEAFSGRSPSHS